MTRYSFDVQMKVCSLLYLLVYSLVDFNTYFEEWKLIMEESLYSDIMDLLLTVQKLLSSLTTRRLK